MEVLFVNDTFGGKQDVGTDVQVNASGVRVVLSTGLPSSSVTSGNVALGTTAAAILTGVTLEFLQLSHVNVLNTGASTRTVTLYLERADAIPDYTATDVWCVLTLLASERAEWTPSGWLQFDSAGRELGLPIAATQSDQETGTSLTTFVSPGRQQWHPSSPKAWFSSGVAADLQQSYNITSLTDTGTGIVTITIATDFAAATFAVIAQVEATATTWAVANARETHVRNATRAVGSVALDCIDNTVTTCLVKDPLTWHVVMFGDQ